MDYADSPRQGDLDGRGNLSRQALVEFTTWFLEVCLDQVTFMGELFALDTLVYRLKLYVERRELKPEAFAVLEQMLQRGDLRSDLAYFLQCHFRRKPRYSKNLYNTYHILWGIS